MPERSTDIRPRRITILDTTLRDGDQAAGFAFSPDQKLELARSLAEAGVDIIETGFPLSNRSDFNVCRQAAEEFPGRTAVMCRSRPEDIRESAKVFAGGIPGLLHLSLPVSRIHIHAKLGKTEAGIITMVREAVSYAKGFVPRVELGAEDASRADKDFLQEYCEAALDAGAEIINIADTLGRFAPGEIRDLISFLFRRIPRLNSSNSILSVHCHNDLGLACANTLAAIEAGCGQAEVSVLGLGERAGNAALEELAANLDARPDLYHAVTGILPEKLGPLIRLSAEAAKTGLSPMKPLSGWNTRAHGSGIHQQGLLKNAETYSIPEMERWNTIPERIVLSRHSGQAGAALFARRYCGLELDDAALSRICAHLKGEAEPPGETFSATLGITEFLCLLSDMKLLPKNMPRPWICRSFSETFTKDDSKHNVIIKAAVVPYGIGKPVRKLAGEGYGGAIAVLKAVNKIKAVSLRLSRFEINGYGNQLRLYAEITVSDDTGKEIPYAIERTGLTAGLPLFQCCMDAVNAFIVSRSRDQAIT
ncbi:LeuA family protein [Treponema primitia]|uniref:LeuA family protein n=1 Tax=Treponema primitia TaxID=88058 RepID=UPI000255590E|nr:2-isopropylmalate synthase [Treponema primitia]